MLIAQNVSFYLVRAEESVELVRDYVATVSKDQPSVDKLLSHAAQRFTIPEPDLYAFDTPENLIAYRQRHNSPSSSSAAIPRVSLMAP